MVLVISVKREAFEVDNNIIDIITNHYFTHCRVCLQCFDASGRKGIRPVKNWSDGALAWLSDLHVAQLMPLPRTVSCFSKIQPGFTFLVPAYPGSPGKRAV